MQNWKVAWKKYRFGCCFKPKAWDKKVKMTLWTVLLSLIKNFTFCMDGIQLSQDCRATMRRQFTFLPLCLLEFLVLIWSKLERWNAVSILEPRSGFEPGTLDRKSSALTISLTYGFVPKINKYFTKITYFVEKLTSLGILHMPSLCAFFVKACIVKMRFPKTGALTVIKVEACKKWYISHVMVTLDIFK